MEPSKEAIAVRITRLNRQILGKLTGGTSRFMKKTIDRESLLDAITVLYDECNDDPVKKCDELVKAFVDKYRSTLAELRRTRVCLSDFDVVQTIGRGHFGEVHMVREKQTGDVYALKTLRKEQSRKKVSSAAEDERDVLALAAGGAWIPKLQYAFQDSTSLYLVMELCSGGDLAGLLARRSHPLSERDAAFYVAEVAQALKALHGMGYVHRDVKPHNILLDRCGHVKLGDFGSCARLSDGGETVTPVGTPDYVAPELLAAAECATRHTVCLEYCRGIVTSAISACDYWSLGVVAFELVTLKTPFSSDDDDSISQILANIQKYERDPNAEPPFDPSPHGPGPEWRSLVSGLLRVQPSRRFNYLDTLQHPALSHYCMHSIRDQAPPWVPCLRGCEDTSYFSPPPRVPPPPSAAPFRSRPPFAGQLPFIGYSYVAPDDNEDSSSGFNASHDCTAIDLATFKSAEKLVAMRGREIASLQKKLAAAEAGASAEAERTRRAADAEAERTRARLQAEITALSLQNRRLERQIEVEKEERMALERTNQELNSGIAERNNAELRSAQSQTAELQSERDVMKEDMRRLEERVSELQSECARALAAADTARAQQKHYKDSIAKERALRRQTLTGGEAESREANARVAAAEANAAKELRARELLEKRLATVDAENTALHAELNEVRRDLITTQENLDGKSRVADVSTQQLKDLQVQLAQERLRVTSLQAQVQELERGIQAAGQREAALEEQCARTEARFRERLEVAENRAANALQDDTRHREKVQTLEQLVRQLEREVTKLECRSCPACEARGNDTDEPGGDNMKKDTQSDTESVDDTAHAQITLLKEQLERAEVQLQNRAEEIAALRQEARTANLARWRKEREYNEVSLELKSTTRDLKRMEERLANAVEARKKSEEKATLLQSEIAGLRPQYERASEELELVKKQFENLQKTHTTAQAEVDRSRNDIRKLKSELQYSEKRRLHAEQQEELSSRERAQIRDELNDLRTQNNHLVQNNKALQEACSLLEEQLTDLEKLADIHEVKNKDMEDEIHRLRSELEACRSRLSDAERQASERGAAASLASQRHEEAREQARHANCQLQLLREKLENREIRVSELEGRASVLEGEKEAAEAALGSALRRVRALQEECATLRTRAHDNHALALRLQASLDEAQEEAAACREASDAAAAWWRTRETKADATLRQQAKLIDFLQAKVEEAGRKKCSLSNKLFGRSGRRSAASPPLRRANRELREEVDRLRAKLAACNTGSDSTCPPTPKRDKPKKVNGLKLTTENDVDNSLLIVWPDGSREQMHARCTDTTLYLSSGDRELKAKLHNVDAKNLPQNEANRAFTIKVEDSSRGSEAAVVCANISDRATWVLRLSASPPPTAGYCPPTLLSHSEPPQSALYVAPNAVAIGCSDGLYSLRGAVRCEWEGDVSPPRHNSPSVECVASTSGRALFVCSGMLAHTGLLVLGSSIRRAANLNPAVALGRVHLPDATVPHLVKTISCDTDEGLCAAIACGRKVFLLRFDASYTEFKIARSLTVDRPPSSLLLTNRTLYIAGEKPLKVNLPSGTLETFALEEPIIAAAAKKRSPPKAIILIRDQPPEILLCYSECGVFVDECGRRSRNEDPKWSSAVHSWEFVSPFLYVFGEDRITILYINEDAYRAPPCTCDSTSLTSSNSEFYLPEVFNFKVKEPVLLGTAPNGVIVAAKDENGYKVFIVEGMAAFRSVGASIESLETISDSKGSSTDLAQSIPDLRPQNVSQESVEPNTGFLADIRKKAKQLRRKNRSIAVQRSPDDVIKEILTAEVGLKRPSNGRKSPASTSEFDSDTDSEDETESTKGTADLCAEMFTRQVRFE